MSALAAGAWALLIALWLGTSAHKKELRERAFEAWLGQKGQVLRKPREVSAAVLLADVIARLKSGTPVEEAWRGSLTDAGLHWAGMDSEGVPTLPKELGASASSVEAACRLTYRIGAPLAQILESVLETIDEVEAAERDRAVARAGPQTTAKILAALPLLGIVAGGGFGVDVIDRWLEGGVATISLIIGIGFWVAGVVWSKRLIRAASLAGERVDPIVMIDLLIASLSAGASIPHSLDALSNACREPQFARCAALLRMGAPFDSLLDQVDDNLRPMIDALRPAWTLGAAPAPMLHLLARRIRQLRVASAREEAEKLAVRLVIPLGLCLLPAFVAISVVPIVTSISLPGF
ncbi:MAG: type II secretion system F family protein [Actinomycetaceae bacterium]|nr:type II secretion system F family protein [Actinomycetaceae bacterium]